MALEPSKQAIKGISIIKVLTLIMPVILYMDFHGSEFKKMEFPNLCQPNNHIIDTRKNPTKANRSYNPPKDILSTLD